MLARLMSWHRRLAYFAGIVTLLWVASGLLHPFMSYWGPRAASFMPPVQEVSAAPSSKGLASTLRQLGGQEIRGLRLLKLGHDLTWQVATETGFSYYTADLGKENPDFGPRYAEFLSQHYTGGKHAAPSVSVQSEFDVTYPPINRLLSVYKVAYENGLTAYVDPGSDRLGALTDPVRVIALKAFQTIHTLSFLDQAEAVRVLAILFAVTSILAMGVIGSVLRARLKYRAAAQMSRKAHGIGAYLLWVPVLMLSVSGLAHLLVRSPLVKNDVLPQAESFVAETGIKLPPLHTYTDLRLLSRQGKLYWRVGGKPALYYGVDDMKPVSEDMFVAGFLGPEAKEGQQVFKFSDEYGFAYKRLPVWRFEQDGYLRFVDPVDGVIAAEVRPLEVKETWLFTRLHKWQFLDVLTGKRWRDAVMAVIVLLIGAMAVTGLMLKSRRRG